MSAAGSGPGCRCEIVPTDKHLAQEIADGADRLNELIQQAARVELRVEVDVRAIRTFGSESFPQLLVRTLRPLL